MAAAKPLVTTLSTKGQLILPKAVRDRHGWASGDRLVVEERPEGVLLRRAPRAAPTRLEDVAGMLKHLHKGPALTPEEEDARLSEAFARDWKRFEKTGTDYED